MLLLSPVGEDCTLLLINMTRGRGESTDATSGNTRPSSSVTFAAIGRPAFQISDSLRILGSHQKLFGAGPGGQFARHE